MINTKLFTILLLLTICNSWAKNVNVIAIAPINGQVSSCQCGGRDMGGLAKIHTVSYNYKTIGPVLLNGNNMDLLGNKTKNNLILQQLSKMNIAAVGVGWAELKGELLPEIMNVKTAGLPWVNCNLFYAGNPLTNRSVRYELNGVKYVITSAISDIRVKSPLLEEHAKELKVLPVTKSIFNEFISYKEGTDIFVVLSDMSIEDENELVVSYKDDKPLLIITSNGEKGIDDKRNKGRVFILNPGSKGLQTWQASYDSTAKVFDFIKSPIDSSIESNSETATAVDIYIRVAGNDSVISRSMLVTDKSDMITVLKNEIILFYAPNCDDCREIIENSLPNTKKVMKQRIRYTDITNASNYQKLMDLQKKTGMMTYGMPVAFYNGVLYDGKEKVGELFKIILSKSKLGRKGY
ncbi:hypothetical protein HZA73_03840 [candidate division TA06 bacterium]|nr:hypothetical protein [candidate division TA06 bacterium]